MIAAASTRAMLDWVVGKRGYVLKDKSLPPRGLAESMQILQRRGFAPATVIDVGVGYGTPWLYQAFPTAHFELFEPLDVFRSEIEAICSRLNARYHAIALGSQSGTQNIEMYRDVPTSSTMAGHSGQLSPLAKSRGEDLAIEVKDVPVRRLDEFGPFEGPVLLKLDVEGMESDVLRGAPRTLESTDVLVSEASVTPRHARDISIGAFLSLVESFGFQLIDIPALSSLRRDGPLSYLDAAFARTGSDLVR